MAVSKQFRFGTIVVAMDFSENSAATLCYVQSIARWCGAKLVLVHVIDPMGYAFPTGMHSSISTDQAAGENRGSSSQWLQGESESTNQRVTRGKLNTMVAPSTPKCRLGAPCPVRSPPESWQDRALRHQVVRA